MHTVKTAHRRQLHLLTRRQDVPVLQNEAFLGLTTISRCQLVGDPDVNNPKLAIRKEQSKRSQKSEIIGGG
jgi:hypothetical protein